MQASQVEDEAVADADAELLQAADVALDEPTRHVGRLHFLAGGFNGRRDEVDAGHIPAVLGHVHRVGARAAAEIERFAGSSGLWSLDQLLQLRRWDPGVPGLESESIHGPKHETREAVGHQRSGEAAGDGRSAVRRLIRAKATAIVTARAGAQSMKPPKLTTCGMAWSKADAAAGHHFPARTLASGASER